jgi:2-methylcitrate dehydratase PrpD
MRPKQANSAEKLAAWVARLRPRNVPRAVRETAKEHLLDGFATMLAGATEEASSRIDRHLIHLGGKGEATVLGTNTKLPAQHAALANGVRGHVLDFDDAQLSSRPDRPFGQLTHPTTPILAAALAVAERNGAAGLQLVTAYTAGVEVACRLADAVDPRHYLNGFHPTGTLATFGASAACAHLLRLDLSQILHAFGIAGTLAAGVRAQRGTMAKALNAGRAAENGVMAALLAQDGFTASKNIFDDPMGYFSAACYGRVDRTLIEPGRPFFFLRPGIGIKLYPCAGVMHPALDAIIETVERHDIQPAQVQSVRVRLGPDAALPLVYERPRSGLEAKFSLPFSAAAAILYRKAGLAQYSDEQARNPALIAIMQRVKLERVPKLRSLGNSGARAEIEIATVDGRSFRRRAARAKGHPKTPLSRADLTAKFRECARGSIPAARADEWLAALWRIEKVPSVRPLLRLLRPARH